MERFGPPAIPPPSAPADRRAALVICLVHVLLALVFLAPRYIRPDSVGVTSWLRSAVVDGDLLFFDEWAGFRMLGDGYAHFKEVTPAGALANHWGPGSSVLASPFYLASHALSLLAPGDRLPDDGFFGLDLATLGWVSVLCSALACLCAYHAVRQLDPEVGPGTIAAALLVTAVGTPWFWYAFRMPLGTHAAGVATVGALCLLVVRLLHGRDVSGLLIGLTLGLACLTRLQHAALAPLLLWAGLYTRRPRSFWFGAVLGLALPAAIQATAWWGVYGNPLGPLVSGATSAGTTYLPFARWSLAPVLLSPWRGLLAWSPVAAVAVAGWVTLALTPRSAPKWRSRRATGAFLVLAFGLELLANSTLDRFWWGGLSFGPRRFVDLAVPFAVGVAAALAGRWRRPATVLAAAAALWSTGLMVAAGSRGLDLSRVVDWAGLARAAVVAPWSARVHHLRSPLSEPGFLALLLLALGLVALVAAAFLWMARSVGVATVVTGWLLVVLLGVAAAAWRTPGRAGAERRRFGLDTARARVGGPLVDQRSLLGLELEWLESTGDSEGAARTRQDLVATERALGAAGIRFD